MAFYISQIETLIKTKFNILRVEDFLDEKYVDRTESNARGSRDFPAEIELFVKGLPASKS